MKQALTYIVSLLVDDKDKVVIDEVDQNGAIQYTITVAPEDMGKVIGKEGKVIRSIRNVMKIAAIKQNKHVSIALFDPAAT